MNGAVISILPPVDLAGIILDSTIATLLDLIVIPPLHRLSAPLIGVTGILLLVLSLGYIMILVSLYSHPGLLLLSLLPPHLPPKNPLTWPQ